jgi:ABC-type multidrug transport system ATPase subunit
MGYSIHCENAGLRYNVEWIFREVNISLSSGDSLAILGGNGSGKSTLLKALSSYIPLSEGQLMLKSGEAIVTPENYYKRIAVAAPYLELIEEFTLKELLEFHFKLKYPLNNLNIPGIISLLDLKPSENKLLKYFSSGMKQRVKLALAIFSDTPLLLLDEPTSNLDKRNTEWFRKMITDFSAGRMVIVCSNYLPAEYDFCLKTIVMEDFKNKKVSRSPFTSG